MLDLFVVVPSQIHQPSHNHGADCNDPQDEYPLFRTLFFQKRFFLNPFHHFVAETAWKLEFRLSAYRFFQSFICHGQSSLVISK